MDPTSTLLFFMLLATALLPVIFAFQLTRLAHSIYRNRLWILRDRITDDIRRGVIGESEPARAIKSLVDNQILLAGRHTLADSFLAISIFNVEGETSVFEEILSGGAPQADKSMLTGYVRDFQKATLSHLKWGSIFGWVFSAFFWLASTSLTLARLLAKRPGRQSHRRLLDAPDERSSTKPAADKAASRHALRHHRGGTRGRSRSTVEQAAQEFRQKVERAEVEIMPTATPSRRGRAAAGALAGR